MKITIICAGRTKERFIRDGIEKYLRFLKHYAEVEIVEIKDEKGFDLKDAPVVRKKEAERIQRVLRQGAMIIALDERGQEFTSHEFAGLMNGYMEKGVREIIFIIGGAFGLDESITGTGNAHRTLALSRLTFTHEMARLVLLEQLYRAFTIITGKTYHY